MSYVANTAKWVTTISKEIARRITAEGTYPLSPTGWTRWAGLDLSQKKTPREKTSRGALGAGLRADLPVAFRPRNHRFLDLDIRAGRIHELLEIDGGGPVCVTLPTLEQRKGLLKHRERPIGGVDRLRYGL